MSEPEVRARIEALRKAGAKTRRPRWVLLGQAAADLSRTAREVEAKMRKQWDWIEAHPDAPEVEEWTDKWLETHGDWVTLQRALRDAGKALDERSAA